MMKYIVKKLWRMVFLSLIAAAINTNLLPSQIPYNFDFRTSDLSGADNSNNLPQQNPLLSYYCNTKALLGYFSGPQGYFHLSNDLTFSPPAHPVPVQCPRSPFWPLIPGKPGRPVRPVIPGRPTGPSMVSPSASTTNSSPLSPVGPGKPRSPRSPGAPGGPREPRKTEDQHFTCTSQRYNC